MEDNIFDKVHEVDLKKTMEDSYIDYAMSVIASRALSLIHICKILHAAINPPLRAPYFSIASRAY